MFHFILESSYHKTCIKPKGLKNGYDWPRVIKNPENLRSTRRWCQITKRNYLQNGSNGCYEFCMFEKRPDDTSAINDDFWDFMNEAEEEESDLSSEASSPRSSTTWANQMQLTEGEEQEEYPFSEDEDSVQIDFPEEDLNDWDNPQWRSNFAIAINEAYDKVYAHNEAIKNDPNMARKKPVDIDPYWGFAMQQILERDRIDQEKDKLVQEKTEIEIGDGEGLSDATSTSIHAYDTDSNTIITDASLNEAVLGIETRLLEDTNLDQDQTAVDEGEVETAVSEASAEVLLIERQEEVIILQEDRTQSPSLQESRSSASTRFDFEDFKARLLKFKNRENSELSDSRNKT